MPTEKKRDIVAALVERFRGCTVAIGTDFRGLSAKQMTELRQRLREQSVGYLVVKNRLAVLAAKEAGLEVFTQLLEGSTGIAFGQGEPSETAKAVDEYIKSTRSGLVVRSAVMDGELLSAAQVAVLASLPSKQELLVKLLGQMNAPIAGLVNVLNGPIQALTIVLQRRGEQLAA